MRFGGMGGQMRVGEGGVGEQIESARLLRCTAPTVRWTCGGRRTDAEAGAQMRGTAHRRGAAGRVPAGPSRPRQQSAQAPVSRVTSREGQPCCELSLSARPPCCRCRIADPQLGDASEGGG
eukprot:6891371-Prymnesium_polylepis.1